jgi:RNA polymerase sigma-70 factor (ECF subfamily)
MLLSRGGLEAAFDVLVRRHQAKALKVAARCLGGNVFAPDAVQNCFVEIYRSLPSYGARGRFSAYLYRVLLNQCRMLKRSARIDARALERVLAESSNCPSLDENQILARERQRELEQALSCLSEKLREVVVLRYSADLSYDEIALALAVPLGTVKRRLFDALRRLQDSMEVL